MKISRYGTTYWYNDCGELHSVDDNPSVIYEDGSKTWHRNGKLHRGGDQPAVIRADGSKGWYKDGIRMG